MDQNRAYEKANRKLFNATRSAIPTAPMNIPRAVSPSIDDLWKSTTNRQLAELVKRHGEDVVVRWLDYMKRKGGGSW
jgi:hypothetical protein